jgi:peptide deformylase
MINSVPELLPIRIIGDKILRQKAAEVAELTDEIRKFIKNLIHTMYIEDGIGLAAPQVGRSLRIFVVDPYWYKEGYDKNPRVMINPRFLEFSGEETEEEGCLSLPEIYGPVSRAEKVVIEGLNENFEKIQVEAEDLFARSLQHENDHLDGILFIDKVPTFKRMILNKKVMELQKMTNEKGENIKRPQNEDQ